MSSAFNIPAGWKITIEGDTAQIVSPIEGPGITVVAEQSRRLEDRMLFAIAKAFAAPPVDAVPGEPVADEKIDELVALIAGSETDFDRGIPRFQVIRSKVRDWLDTNFAASVAVPGEPETNEDFLADVYDQCCRAIKPAVDRGLLPGSVVESLQILVAEKLATTGETK